MEQGAMSETMPLDPAMLEDFQSNIQGAERQRQSDEIDFKLGQKQVDDLRRSLLADLFGVLRENGVDPNDPNSIHEFTQRLEQEDPDFAALFEYALNVLAPPMQSIEEAPPVSNPMAGRDGMMAAIGRGSGALPEEPPGMLESPPEAQGLPEEEMEI